MENKFVNSQAIKDQVVENPRKMEETLIKIFMNWTTNSGKKNQIILIL